MVGTSNKSVPEMAIDKVLFLNVPETSQLRHFFCWLTDLPTISKGRASLSLDS
jgi:hypothetical protein